ncbi:MAG: type I DNA topoisomerase [Alphaproteobacteria bacterium]|nr:type I DNA topoisomerase [Alphaproteobacteria bacterium]
MNIVIVESPAKAKTINKYLGKDHIVIPSFGHVRDLSVGNNSVRPHEEFNMDWEIDERGEKQLKQIIEAIRSAHNLILATDPDREGEAISWHIRQELEKRKNVNLNKIKIQRVVFYEITQPAVLKAMAEPRELDQNLIDAYLARRALDYLVGFTLSPLLWRKLPGSKSAGRVQSVALRLICERETEIELFRPQEYWSVNVSLETVQAKKFNARLTHLNGKKLEKFDLSNSTQAHHAAEIIKNSKKLIIKTIDKKTVQRHPLPPFTTSTLQQESSRKLGLSAMQTMRLAQKLYEGVDLKGETVGLITYMRTDSVNLSQEALLASRKYIEQHCEKNYLPAQQRHYKSSIKNAQEAHESIRPTDIFRHPKEIGKILQDDEARLYELIWKRTVASQMASAVMDQVAVDIQDHNHTFQLRANGSILTFDGFLSLYQEDFDDPNDDDNESSILPAMLEGQEVYQKDIQPKQHFTLPPPRFTEASLVKKLEELGIGRPSTYASILQVLQNRSYVKLEKKRFIPEDNGRLVTTFLINFFEHYFAYDFTASLEQQLDDITNERISWKNVLKNFWSSFSTLNKDEHKEVLLSVEEAINNLDKMLGKRSDIIDVMNDSLGPYLFPQTDPNTNPRACPACSDGILSIKLSKNGSFIGCSNYPNCTYTRSLHFGTTTDNSETNLDTQPKILGHDPNTQEPISLRKGPYGFYVQLSEVTEDKKKPKRIALPKTLAPSDLTLDQALILLSLPRDIGIDPQTNEMITAGIGRFGPYLKRGDSYISLKNDDVLTIGLNRAVILFNEKPAKSKTTKQGKTVGTHPDDQKAITYHEGRFGPYLKYGKNNIKLPEGINFDNIDIDKALDVINSSMSKKNNIATTSKKKTTPKKKATSKK